MLYLCPTPIGNLEDMTYRTVRILKEADVIAAEDTRHSGMLLKHYDIHTPMLSYHQHNEAKRTEELIEKLKRGVTVALISDAGMPGISDPGTRLIMRMIEEDLPYTVLPGANAAITAMVASGFNPRGFCYLGFLPTKKKERQQLMESIKSHHGPLIFYESPHRLLDTLEEMEKILGNREAVLCRELTKLHETYHRGGLKELAQNHEPRGEYVIVVEGKRAEDVTDEELVASLRAHIDEGMRRSDAVAAVTKAFHVNRNRVYQLSLKEL